MNLRQTVIFFKLLPLGPEIDIHFLRIILNPYENNISNCQKIKNIFPESPVEFTRTMVKNMNTNYIYRCGNGNKWIGPTCVHCLVRGLRPCVRRPHELWVVYMQSILMLRTAFGPPEMARRYATLLNCHVHPASSQVQSQTNPGHLAKIGETALVSWWSTMLSHAAMQTFAAADNTDEEKTPFGTDLIFYKLLTHRISSD